MSGVGYQCLDGGVLCCGVCLPGIDVGLQWGNVNYQLSVVSYQLLGGHLQWGGGSCQLSGVCDQCLDGGLLCCDVRLHGIDVSLQ